MGLNEQLGSHLHALFKRRVNEGGLLPDECWEWPAQERDRWGYGKLTYRHQGVRRTVGAHRLSYELNVGPIPAGMEIMHQCDNPACVNPAHLKLGTRKENEEDKVAKGRSVRGEQKSTLSNELAQELLDRYRDGESLKLLAVEFDLPYKTAEAIAHRRRFKYLQ